MTIDEIREKYHCDKRQTGQLFIRGDGRGGDFRKTKITDPKEVQEFKREKRAMANSAPGAETTAYNAKMKRQSKAWFLGELRNLENAIKKSDDKTAIRTAFEKMSVKFKELLNQL